MAQDKYHGQGGSYTVSPKTGERELMERTLSPEEAADKAAKEKASETKPGKEK